MDDGIQGAGLWRVHRNALSTLLLKKKQNGNLVNETIYIFGKES